MTKPYLMFALVACLLSCTDQLDLAYEKQAIQKILLQERKAHFDKDVDLFLSTFADTMIMVNKGKVDYTTLDANKERFGNYFSRVNFIKWDDVTPPDIEISDDGTMAYAVLKKLVIVEYADSPGIPVRDTTGYAWISIYRKHNGEWKGVCNASTRESLNRSVKD